MYACSNEAVNFCDLTAMEKVQLVKTPDALSRISSNVKVFVPHHFFEAVVMPFWGVGGYFTERQWQTQAVEKLLTWASFLNDLRIDLRVLTRSASAFWFCEYSKSAKGAGPFTSFHLQLQELRRVTCECSQSQMFKKLAPGWTCTVYSLRLKRQTLCDAEVRGWKRGLWSLLIVQLPVFTSEFHLAKLLNCLTLERVGQEKRCPGCGFFLQCACTLLAETTCLRGILIKMCAWLSSLSH